MGDVDGDDVLIEAGIDGEQVVERAREQQRANQQDQRQRHLRHDQRAPHTEALSGPR